MLVVRLKRARDEYRKRSGHRLTWKALAKQIDADASTLRNMCKPGYNANFRKLEKIARVLKMKALDLIEEIPDPPPSKKKTKKKAGKKAAKKKTKKKA